MNESNGVKWAENWKIIVVFRFRNIKPGRASMTGEIQARKGSELYARKKSITARANSALFVLRAGLLGKVIAS